MSRYTLIRGGKHKTQNYTYKYTRWNEIVSSSTGQDSLPARRY